MSGTLGFFDEQTSQSRIKAEIVSEYFYAWSKIILSKAYPPPSIINYIDLFAGKGEYNDGSASTPRMVLDRIIGNPDLAAKVVAYFNDADPSFVDELERSAIALPGYSQITHPPRFSDEVVGERIVQELDQIIEPTLLFVDPWGYKGLSLRLINSVLKNHASEVIFFFNYRRINMAINNRFMNENISALFERDRADALRSKVRSLHPEVRERAVIEAVDEALRSQYAKHTIAFKFYDDQGTRVTHHIVFATKHPLGYGVMKDILASKSTGVIEGIPTYEYNPREQDGFRIDLFPEHSIPILCDDIMNTYSGKSLLMKDIYHSHHINKPYIKKNYKTALLKLETLGKVTVDPTTRKRRDTMPDEARLSFR